MEILNLGGAAESNSPAPKARKKLRVLLGIGALAAVTGIGSTLAANISLNGGGNVEFGQGVATTAACDDDITLTPISTFSNTEEDATFAMTAIQVDHIDLTPEGWDWDADGGPNWYSQFNIASHTWNSGYEEHAGQYRDGSGNWINTCENKVLMLRAFTDNYQERTVDNNINSPLYLNGYSNARPLYFSGTNAGVAFRVSHSNDSNPTYWADYFNLDEDWAYAYTAADIDDVNFDFDDSSVTIYLDGDTYYPPLDSRWVDKLTVESAATLPASWDSGA